MVGIKDSSGDWNNTESMLQRGWDNFHIFAGSESFLLQTMRQGGAGCISATANINPAAIDALFREWPSENADRLQERMNLIRNMTQSYPMIPALKSVIAKFSGCPEWRVVRPPLVALADADGVALVDQLIRAGFDMPGLVP